MANDETIQCLIIDDDSDDFFITEEALKEISSRPHVATWAPTYEEAESLLASREFDVCLVDYRIGGRTGLEFIRDSVQKGCRTPMILLTGLSSQDVDEEASAAGAFDFIEKSEVSGQLLERSIRFSITQADQIAKLEANSRLLRATLEHTGAGIAAFGKNREIETFNTRLLEILDIAAPEYDGQAGDIIGADSDLARQILEKIDVFAEGTGEFMESALPDGRVIETRINNTPDGRCVIVCSDVTARKVAEAELIESREAALAGSEAKSRFIANMSHELKTPLHAIIGFTEIVQAQLRAADSKNVLLDHTYEVLAGGSHLLNLIEEILTISKLDNGEITLQNDWFYLRELIQSCDRRYASDIDEKNLDFSVDIPAEDVAIQCDAEIMKKALLNLVSNAIKFTEPGKRIGIEAAEGPDKSVRLTVWDEGIGMTKDEIEQCIEPFSQVDSSLSRQYEGTGLGLPLVKRFLELHDGWLEIDSEKDVGTRISIFLPASRVKSHSDDAVPERDIAAAS